MADEIMMLSDLVSVYRNQSRRSLSAIAKMAGCTKAHVWDMERGVACNPTIRTIDGLSFALGLSFEAVARSARKSASPLCR